MRTRLNWEGKDCFVSLNEKGKTLGKAPKHRSSTNYLLMGRFLELGSKDNFTPPPPPTKKKKTKKGIGPLELQGKNVLVPSRYRATSNKGYTDWP